MKSAATGKAPAFQWYPGDHRRDTAVQACSFEARALWREMLDLMHDGSPRGYLTAGGVEITIEQLARLVGAPLPRVRSWLKELEDRRVFSRTDDGVIYSRRMVKDEHISQIRREAGKHGGNPNLVKQHAEQIDNQIDGKGASKNQPLQFASADCGLRSASAASTSPPDSSNKRSGDLPADAGSSPAAAAPLADADAPELPREAEELLAVSYPDPAVRDRKRREVQRTLTSGAKYRGHLVLAQSARRLAVKCQELLDNPPRDASKAVAVLLVKLSDMSDGSAPGAVAAAEEQQEAERTEGEIARELIDANAWIEDHPEHERKIANMLEHNGFPRPEPAEDEMLTRARGIARNELVRRAYRQRSREAAHA